MMIDAVHCEIVKAFAYGKTRDEIKRVMKVTDEELNRVAEEEIAAKRDRLREMGYIR